jgi:para-nitrobenzyl esterase
MLSTYGVKTPESVNAGIDHLVHDMFFAGPARLQVRAHTKMRSGAWLYLFAQVPPTAQGKNFGSTHTAELPYVFGEVTANAPWGDADRRVSDMVMGYWTQFAASGDPNRTGLLTWPRYDAKTDTYMLLTDTPKTATGLHRDAALFDRFEAHRRTGSR